MMVNVQVARSILVIGVLISARNAIHLLNMTIPGHFYFHQKENVRSPVVNRTMPPPWHVGAPKKEFALLSTMVKLLLKILIHLMNVPAIGIPVMVKERSHGQQVEDPRTHRSLWPKEWSFSTTVTIQHGLASMT